MKIEILLKGLCKRVGIYTGSETTFLVFIMYSWLPKV